MIITKRIYDAIKSLRDISEDILILPGDTLQATSADLGTQGIIKVDGTFEKEVYISSLRRFVYSLGLFKSPEISFHDNYIEIKNSDGNHKVLKYMISHSLKKVNKKYIQLERVQMFPVMDTFELTKKMMDEFKSVGKMIELDIIKFIAKDGKLVAELRRNTDLTDSYISEIADTSSNFSFSVRLARMHFINDTYRVNIINGAQGLYFHNTSLTNHYLVACENAG